MQFDGYSTNYYVDYTRQDEKVWSSGASPDYPLTSGSTDSFVFKNVNVNEITDRVTVKVTRVATDNGVDLSKNNSGGLGSYRERAISSLDSKTWKIVDAETAGRTGLIQISAGTVRNPNTARRRYTRTITAETDKETVD
jgi:hypothetical protein